jgi:hypothetical protein
MNNNVNFISRHNLPSVGFTDQITGLVYPTQEAAKAAQDEVIYAQDSLSGSYVPRVLPLAIRIALHAE